MEQRPFVWARSMAMGPATERSSPLREAVGEQGRRVDDDEGAVQAVTVVSAGSLLLAPGPVSVSCFKQDCDDRTLWHMEPVHEEGDEVRD